MKRRDLATLQKLAAAREAGRQIQIDGELRQRLVRLSAAGDATASSALAWVHLSTRPRSKRRAEELYRSAIRGVNKRSTLYNLALLCLESRRKREGLAFLKRSARLGYGAAQFYLATKYFDGKVVRRSLSEAELWFRRAYRNGSAEAALWLGWKRDFHDGTRWVEAVHWYRRAAERGNATAMFNFALCLERGLGVRVDLRGARRWYAKAARTGDKDALRKLDELRKPERPARRPISRRR